METNCEHIQDPSTAAGDSRQGVGRGVFQGWAQPIPFCPMTVHTGPGDPRWLGKLAGVSAGMRTSTAPVSPPR
jgi:hypothetical protein